MLTIRPVAYAEILGAVNAAELLAEYAAECALPELAPVAPQAEAYAAMERAGMFQCFGAFHEGALVGFASLLIYMAPHYGKRVAAVESLFLAAAHRRGASGGALIEAMEKHARKLGCAAIGCSAPLGSRLARLMFLMTPEYRHSNHVFTRRLG